jgi:hypothetical protein
MEVSPEHLMTFHPSRGVPELGDSVLRANTSLVRQTLKIPSPSSSRSLVAFSDADPSSMDSIVRVIQLWKCRDGRSMHKWDIRKGPTANCTCLSSQASVLWKLVEGLLASDGHCWTEQTVSFSLETLRSRRFSC